MRKYIISIFCLTTFLNTFAQETLRTVDWDGLTREHLEYLPESYNSSQQVPVLIYLHGNAEDMSSYSENGFAGIADQHGWIIISPRAVYYENTFGYSGYLWNSGISLLGTTFNDDVDDIGYINVLIDSAINNLSINTDSVFVVGYSFGAFLCNRYAIDYGYRLAGISSVGGTLGNTITPQPLYTTSSIHIHGLNDQVITYDGLFGSIEADCGLGAEELVDMWKSFDACNSIPTQTFFPNTFDDGLSFERLLYPEGTDNTKVALIKGTEAEHTWYKGENTDIDYTTEIYKFFTNTMDFPSSVNNSVASGLRLFPNPASSSIAVKIENTENSSLLITDISGKKVLNLDLSENETNIDISGLSQGLYIVRINQNGNISEQKLVVTR